MPQQFLHHLEFSPHAPQKGGVGVAKCVPTKMLLNAQFLRLRSNELAQDRLAPKRFPAPIAPACKDPIVRFPVGLLFSPFQESLDNERMNRHGLLRRFGLAMSNDSADDRPCYVDRSFVKVDITPLQAKQLTLAESG